MQYRGGLGSRLHKAEVGTWYAYAQWPSKDFVWFDVDGKLLELLAKSPLPQYDRRRVSFAFEVDDIHSARAKLIDRGVEAITEIEGGPQSRQYWAYFKDVEGNLFELVQILTCASGT